MKIILKNFRSYIDKTFDFKNDSITLLRGRSGSGKTTVFEAIYWCLYKKLQMVYPNFDKDCTTSVEIKLKGMTIYRSRNPAVFQVTEKKEGFKKMTYEMKVAEQYIENKFGPKEIWMSCCYIRQNEKSHFLSCPNEEKMKVLNSTIFSFFNPGEKINKITAKISEKVDDLNEKKNDLLIKKGIHDSKFSKVLPEHLLPKENNLGSELEELKEEKEKLEKVQKLREKNVIEIKTLEKTVLPILEWKKKNKNPTLPKLKFISDSNVSEINNQLLLISQLEKMEKGCVSTFTEEDFFESKNIEKSIILEKGIAKSFSLTYDKKIISKFISDSELNIELNDLSIRYSEFKATEKEFNYTENKINSLKKGISKTEKIEKPDFTSLEKEMEDKNIFLDNLEKVLDELEEEIKTLSLSKGVISCPNCSCSLRYKEGKLLLSENSPFDEETFVTKNKLLEEKNKEFKKTEDSLVILEKEKKKISEKYLILIEKENNKIRENSKITSEIEKLESVLDNLSKKLDTFTTEEKDPKLGKITAIKDVDSMKEKLEKLKKLTFPFTENSSLSIRNSIDSGVKYEKYLSKLSQIDSVILENVKDVRKEILILENFLSSKFKYESDCKFYEEKLVTTTTQIEFLKNKLSPDNSEDIEILSEKISDLENKLKLNKKAILCNKSSIIIKNRVIRNKKEALYLSKMEDFKAILIDKRSMKLKKSIDNLNTYLKYICNKIFLHNISVKLSLHKKLKSGNDKPMINLSIVYNSVECDDLKQFSGGELARISIAILICFSIFNKFPVILIDETFSALDSDIKAEVVNMIKEMCPKKTIISIIHEENSGIYDNTVTI